MTSFVTALAAFKLRQPAHVQAETDAMVARMLGPLDDLQAEASSALGRLHELPELDRRAAPRSAELPESPADPAAAIDSTGVQIGNSDLEDLPAWQPPTHVPERAPLPIYPQPTDLPPPPVSRSWP